MDWSFIDRDTIKRRLQNREFTVNIRDWIYNAWKLYWENWKILSLWALVYILLSAIPYVGFAISMYWYIALVRAGISLIRIENRVYSLSLMDFFIPFPLTSSIFIIFILKLLLVSLGLILFIIPGLYLMVTLFFAAPLYIEFCKDSLLISDALTISRRVTHKKLPKFILFYIVITLLSISGVLFFGIGLLVTIPVGVLAVSVAFKDVFGLRDYHLSRIRDGYRD